MVNFAAGSELAIEARLAHHFEPERFQHVDVAYPLGWSWVSRHRGGGR